MTDQEILNHLVGVFDYEPMKKQSPGTIEKPVWPLIIMGITGIFWLEQRNHHSLLPV